MAAKAKSSGYNAVAEELLIPFDEKDISERVQGDKTFSYVTPEKYRYRLLETFNEGYTLRVEDVVATPTGLSGYGHFIGARENIKYDIRVAGFEAYTISRESQKPIQVSQTYSKLTSELLKGIARELGLGLHLYDKAAVSAKGSTKRSKPAVEETEELEDEPAPKATKKATAPSTGGWTGTDLIKFGKNKGIAYKDIDDGWLIWATKLTDQTTGELKPDSGSVKELARRKGTAVKEASEDAAEASDEEQEFPF